MISNIGFIGGVINNVLLYGESGERDVLLKAHRAQKSVRY